MQETLRALIGLQDLDADIFRVTEEIRRLPEERARRRAAVDAKIHERDEVDRRMHDMQTRIKEIEDHTTTQRQRQRKLEGEAAASRGDAALLAAYQHEIRTLRRDIGEAEEEGLALVERQDEDRARRDALQAELDELETTYAEYGANVERELANAERRKAELAEQRRNRLSDDLDRNVLALYDRLLAAREGAALALLDGSVCQGCYMSVPPNTFVRLSRGRELVQCPSCDRILYLRQM